MNDPSRAGMYLALFSEIGLALLVTILGGTLGGYWVDTQLGTVPLFVLLGLALGMTAGAITVNRLITRFLGRFE